MSIQENKDYDLFLFAGQSNMAGRGVTSSQWPEPAPELISGAGYEYRAISDSKRLYPVTEPFGVSENNPEGIWEPGMKTGSLVTSFINAYYQKTGRSVIGISASKGGSSIRQWQGKSDYLSDALLRLKRAESYLAARGPHPRHLYLLWCQGETDGDLGTSPETYKDLFRHMLDQFQQAKIEVCFLIAIGEYNGDKGFDYQKIRQAQLDLARELPNVALVCDVFHTMRSRGLMKDAFHYYQQAYNEAGTRAGCQAARYLLLNNMPKSVRS